MGSVHPVPEPDSRMSDTRRTSLRLSVVAMIEFDNMRETVWELVWAPSQVAGPVCPILGSSPLPTLKHCRTSASIDLRSATVSWNLTQLSAAALSKHWAAVSGCLLFATTTRISPRSPHIFSFWLLSSAFAGGLCVELPHPSATLSQHSRASPPIPAR